MISSSKISILLLFLMGMGSRDTDACFVMEAVFVNMGSKIILTNL
jgi:hypothetical protein